MSLTLSIDLAGDAVALSLDLAGDIVALSVNFAEWVTALASKAAGEPIGLLLALTEAG